MIVGGRADVTLMLPSHRSEDHREVRKGKQFESLLFEVLIA
jgi:hypothetical protein